MYRHRKAYMEPAAEAPEHARQAGWDKGEYKL